MAGLSACQAIGFILGPGEQAVGGEVRLHVRRCGHTFATVVLALRQMLLHTVLVHSRLVWPARPNSRPAIWIYETFCEYCLGMSVMCDCLCFVGCIYTLVVCGRAKLEVWLLILYAYTPH